MSEDYKLIKGDKDNLKGCVLSYVKAAGDIRVPNLMPTGIFYYPDVREGDFIMLAIPPIPSDSLKSLFDSIPAPPERIDLNINMDLNLSDTI